MCVKEWSKLNSCQDQNQHMMGGYVSGTFLGGTCQAVALRWLNASALTDTNKKQVLWCPGDAQKLQRAANTQLLQDVARVAA